MMNYHTQRYSDFSIKRKPFPPVVRENFTPNLHRPSGIENIQMKSACACGGGCPRCRASSLSTQSKLTVSQPGDRHEREADQVADQLMRSQSSSIATPLPGRAHQPSSITSSSLALGSGQPLSQSERSFFEPRLGTNLGHIRVHNDGASAHLARSINARAFTTGSNITFAAGQYAPHSQTGKRLLAHELVHTIQQADSGASPSHLQRTIGDGHDLQSPRFRLDNQLEKCFDRERFLKIGDRGEGVRKVQQALLDDGYPLPMVEMGVFGLETKTTIEIFQTQKGLKGRDVDGIIGPITMGLLDAHFSGPSPALPVPPTPMPTTPVKGHRFTYSSSNGRSVRVDIRSSCGSPMFGFKPEHFQLVEKETRAALHAIFDTACISKDRRKWIQKGLVSSGLDIRCLRAPWFCAQSTGFPDTAEMTLSSYAFPPGAHRDSLAKCQPLRSAILHEIIHLAFAVFGEALPTSCQKSCFPETPRAYDPTLCRTPVGSGAGFEPL